MLNELKTWLSREFWGSSLRNSNLARPSDWLRTWAFGGEPATSGEHVNERTALGLSTYLACIKNISEDVGKLPCSVYQRLPRGRKSLDNHPVTTLLHDSPNEEMSAMTFRETLTAHALGWHGGFAEIVRDGRGIPTGLYPLDPNYVQVMREDGGQRRLYYLVYGQTFQKEDIFCIHGLGYSGLTGYVLSRLAKDPIGNALAAQKFSGSFFANGTVSTGVLQVPETLSETAFKNLRDSFAERHGGAKNQYKPIILEQGATWTATSTEPQKSQMVEVLQYGVEEVARLFRMPPHKIGHLLRSTNNNIEQQALEYVQDCLLAWLVRWEQEIWRKLLLPSEKKSLFAKFNLNMLLRGDTVSRADFYQKMVQMGVFSPNMVLELEDMNPIDGGDAHFVNAAMVPLDMAAEGDHLAVNQPAVSPNGDNPPQTSTSSDNSKPQDSVAWEIVAASFQHDLAAILELEGTAAQKPKFEGWVGAVRHKKHVSERMSHYFSTPEAATQFVESHISRSVSEACAPEKVMQWINGERAKEQSEDYIRCCFDGARKLNSE